MEIDEEIYNELRRTKQKFHFFEFHGIKDWDKYDSTVKDFNEWLEKDKQNEKINKIIGTYTDMIINSLITAECMQKQSLFKLDDDTFKKCLKKDIANILKGMCTRDVTLKDTNKYEEWANDLMDVIEEIAHEKYPDVPYWLDTGNRYQCCMEMLAHFRKDL